MNTSNANFIAIDFETATPQRMPCQLAIVVVKNGVITKKINHLIQPPKNKYSKKCTAVHGITPDKTADKPTFDKVWNEIKEYFEGNFIVAHNASFDIDVLCKALDMYNISYPIFMGIECTYKLSGLSLEKACLKYNIPLNSHHDGMCDAEASALLFLEYLKGVMNKEKEKKEPKEKTTHEVSIELPVNDPFGCFTDDVIASITPLSEFLDKKFIITGDTVFNRDLAYKIIAAFGGKKASSVSKSLDYIIIGDNPGPKKIELLKELNEEGCSINAMSDHDFVKFIIEQIENISECKIKN